MQIDTYYLEDGDLADELDADDSLVTWFETQGLTQIDSAYSSDSSAYDQGANMVLKALKQNMTHLVIIHSDSDNIEAYGK